MDWQVWLKSFTGASGVTALREAQGNLLAWIERVRAALEAHYKAVQQESVWPNMEAVYADRVIAREDGKLFSYPLSIGANGEILLGTPQEAQEEYVVASASGAPVVLLEAKDGSRFLVRVIRSGLSGNGVFYPDSVLREAVSLFNGARVLVKGDQEHLQGGGKDPRNIVGRLTEAVFVAGGSPDTGEVQATLEILQSAGDMAARLTEAVGRGMADLYGLSIDATGRSRPGTLSGKTVRMVTAIEKIKSVDLIVEPGAGGEVISLIEAQADNSMQKGDAMKEFLLKQVQKRRPDLLAGKEAAALSDAEVESLFREAFPEQPAQQEAPLRESLKDADLAVLDQRIQQAENARTQLREALASSALPQVAQDRLLGRFSGSATYDASAVTAAITDEREYLARATASGRVSGLGGSRVHLVEGQREKIDKMLDAVLTGVVENGGSQSLREAYGAMTGDWRVTGRVDRADSAAMREALDSSSWSNVLGDAMARRMVADYRQVTIYDVWRQLATTVPVNDFRTQERTRYGGYGNLPNVPEAGSYPSVSSPSDEKATYTIGKRGGIEKLTLEMIRNDDVGAVRQIPTKLSRSAKRTLGQFVLDFLRTNPVIYDGKTLFHADHRNLGVDPLGLAAWAIARLAMLTQTEMGSGDRLGIPPKTLWVPPDLEADANDLFRRNTNQEQTFLQSNAPQVVPVWYWTDPTDYCVSADPADIPMIEIGFLDGNQEPELFVQDSPTQGSLFTNDQVTYKIRHIYGGNVLDYRGLYKAVVP
ncbi:MAG: hypothetical protein H7838_07435 [Magnetococcus sp. DMHC-8]